MIKNISYDEVRDIIEANEHKIGGDNQYDLQDCIEFAQRYMPYDEAITLVFFALYIGERSTKLVCDTNE